MGKILGTKSNSNQALKFCPPIPSNESLSSIYFILYFSTHTTDLLNFSYFTLYGLRPSLSVPLVNFIARDKGFSYFTLYGHRPSSSVPPVSFIAREKGGRRERMRYSYI
jgi:hypothetical protein